MRNHFKRYRTEGLAGLNRVGEGVGGSPSLLTEEQLIELDVHLYSSNTNISFFHSADEFETIRQQGTQFALIFARISEEFLTSGFEFGKRFEVLVVQGFLLEEFPEAFDQIQIRRIGREEYELDA